MLVGRMGSTVEDPARRTENGMATRVASLRSPADGLAARVALIDDAEVTLDLQYYEWDEDDVGFVLLDRLLAAADRGVGVRLLVDDLRLRRRTRRMASLCLHRHFEVRVFNPWTSRSSIVAEAVEFVRKFSRLDHRMHNKLMVSDRRRVIVGGRNIADAHYGLDRTCNLVDHDLYIDGPVAGDFGDVFETYWTSAPSSSAFSLDTKVSESDLDAERTLVRQQVTDRADAHPADAVDGAGWLDRVTSVSWLLTDESFQITYDIPGVRSGTERTQVIGALHEAIEGARHEVVAVAPFFVPSEIDVAWYGRLTERGVRARLLTNSLASNNGTISNSGLDRQRKAVVQAGVELYELRPDAAAKPEWELAPNAGRYLGLHVKLYTIDGEKVFLGSINLDPRSKFVNTEVGVLVDSSELAQLAMAGIEDLMAPANAWHVELDGDGRLTWRDDRGISHCQPARNVGQRAANWFYGLLPLNPYI
jgi:putative cardiolipin synthase